MSTIDSKLDAFDHVVVLMMENRSFDNLFGYLYDGDVPPGKKFEGARGQWNPDHKGRGRIETSLTSDPHEPYPDPGEFFLDVFTQLYGKPFPPRNPKDPNDPKDPTLDEPTMNGFVLDYYNTLASKTKFMGQWLPWSFTRGCESRNIMKCFSPSAIPALATLAREFAVFDHWFAATPSETWPNRAFWHAATSWGFADMPFYFASEKGREWSMLRWLASSTTKTLFNLLDKRFDDAQDNWCIYADTPISATELIHLGQFCLEGYYEHANKAKRQRSRRHLQYDGPNFFSDCADGKLPKYAFLEPHMFNFMPPEYFHNDMHPSEWLQSLSWSFLANGGPGSVLLGDHLIWQVYEAIRSSQHRDARGRLLRDRTLLIITFDEHGGCFDHVKPPPVKPPADLVDCQYGFEFKRLGVRVPTVMISSHIAQNTIVNDTMHHNSFLKTMQRKWGLDSLGQRQDDAPCFADAVFSEPGAEPRAWPDLKALYLDHPAIARAKAKPPAIRRSQPLSRLQSSLLMAMYAHLCNLGHASQDQCPTLETQGDAHDFFERYGPLLNKIRHDG